MKACIKCGEIKPIEEFYKNIRIIGGRLNSCKKCCYAYSIVSRNAQRRRELDRERNSKPERKKSLKESSSKRKVSNTEKVIRWNNSNPEKAKAHREVTLAIRNFRLLKRPCWCGDIKVEAHHEDYSKPLEVIWLCVKHHKAEHNKMRDMQHN